MFDVQISRQHRTLAWLAVASGTCGALSTVPVGAFPRAVLLLVLLVAGAGSATMCWVAIAPPAALAAVVGLSVAAVFATATALAWLRLWYPVQSALVLSCVVAAVGILRLCILRRRTKRLAVD